MDFGTLSFEGLVGTDNDESRNPTKGNGSGFLKQERSGSADQQDAWRSSKTARTDAFEAKTLLNQNHRQHQQILGSGSSPLLRSDSGISIDADQNMLSFSNSSFKNGGFVDKTPQNSLFSFHQQPPAPAYIRNAGYGPGGIHESMHVPVSRYKGLFTPSQWMELEHQALIYKHIVANVPVPSHLLTPIRKSLNPFLFSGSSSGAYAPNSFGWGTFHLGFSGNTDPEPGRCRRTDGKKWRCSRDAVPDQKYCERHINRGRHRSRKPVEGQNGQAVAGPTPNSKVGPIASSSASLISNSGTSNTLGAMQHQFKTLQHSSSVNASRETLITGAQESQAPSMVSPTVTLKSKDSSFSIPKQHTSIEGSSDSLLYPSEKSSYMYSTSCNSFLDQDAHNQNPLRHFIDEWPKDQSDRSSVAWPEELKSDWTQLSMSIPMASSDFSSATNSPRQEKLTLAPLGLCHEIEPLPSQKQGANWIPISWGSSMGGPLGEVLNSKKVSDMHHMTDVWENGSYHLGSSPTGVLQKSTFVSLSNSSTASSPRANNREAQNQDVAGGSLCDEMLLSTLASSASIRSL